jgi:hypothetical protein
MPRGTRITVDLADGELLKRVKFAAVEQGKPIREIVVEALRQWLERRRTSGGTDFQAMIQALNEHRQADRGPGQ